MLPLSRCGSMPSSAALNEFSCLGFSGTLISLPPLIVRREVRGGKISSTVKKRTYGCQCHFGIAQRKLEHPLVQGTNRMTPEQPDHCTDGEVGAKRDF